MNNLSCRKLFFLTAASMNPILSCKLFLIHPFRFHFRNVFSTEALSQTLFSQFASTKLNLSEADISRILKSRPHLQNLRSLHNVEKNIHLLNNRGFTDVQSVRILRTHPWLIGSAETILEPKLKLLEDFGFVDQNLVKLCTRNPRILSSSLENSLLPTMEFLKNVFRSQDVFIKALLRAPILLCFSLEKYLKPSLAFWEGWGFSETEIVNFLRVCPSALSRTSLTPAQVGLIQKISADKTGKMFKYIVGTVAVSRTKTLVAKIENFKLRGLSAEETWQLIGAAPYALNYSKENISERMNFIVKNMELPANYVVKHPSLLQISLEKTMKPRFLVWQKIKSINDLDLSPLTVLSMSEARFVSKILKGHPESKTLCAIYESALSNASSRTKSSEKTKFWIGKRGSE